jgi:alpha-glucosidase (family GH31 glycosyl hydrolase)
MWRSHLDAVPPNAPLFYGPFSTDPVLYTDRILQGFDAWMGVGQILTAPQLFEGGLTREVYFPKVSPEDRSLYFDLHAPFGIHTAGEWATIATPIEHGGLFVRESAVIPVGKEKATVTCLSGPARRYTDGVDVVLDTDGGQVGLDDWRGVMLFPGREGKNYTDEWIEDDGISDEPGTCTVNVSYCGTDDSVKVSIRMEENGFTPLWKSKVSIGVEENGFTPLWKGKIYIILPVGDKRTVLDTTQTTWKDRVAWQLNL